MSLPISRFEYYDGSWNEETNIIGLEYRDPIDAPRQLTVKISDPWNTRQDTVGYKEMYFVRLTERQTEEILFFGRIQYVNPKHDDTLGQIIEIECFDMSMELSEQSCNVDYTADLGSGAVDISDVIEEIIDDFVYGGKTGNVRVTKIESSTTSIGGAPSFESKRTAALKAINMLANEDERTPASGKYGWVFRVNNGTQIAGNVAEAVYYYRTKYCGSKCSDESLDASSGDAATNGMTIAFNETETDQKKPMIGGYQFPTYQKEIFTEVHVPYVEDAMYHDFSKKVPDGGGDLEDTIAFVRHKYLSGTGAQNATEAEEIADSWIAQYEQTTAPQKGKVSVNGYPVYTKSAVDYFLTAGSLVHIHLQQGGSPLISSVDNTDMIVTQIIYSEPSFQSTISLVEKDYGFDGDNQDLTSKFMEMVDTTDDITEIANTYGSDGVPTGVLHKAVQPHQCQLTFNIKGTGAPNNDIVQWQDGTIGDGYAIVFTDGDKFWISDGETAIATAISYFYTDISGKVDGDQVTISQTSDFAVAIGTDHVLLAVCEQAPSATEQALVLPSNGKHPILNAIIMTANMVLAEHIKAGNIEADHLESSLVLATTIVCGTAGGARIQLDSSGIECYENATDKYFELISSTGKARCYDEGLEFYKDSTKVASVYTSGLAASELRFKGETDKDLWFDAYGSSGGIYLYGRDDANIDIVCPTTASPYSSGRIQVYSEYDDVEVKAKDNLLLQSIGWVGGTGGTIDLYARWELEMHGTTIVQYCSGLMTIDSTAGDIEIEAYDNLTLIGSNGYVKIDAEDYMWLQVDSGDCYVDATDFDLHYYDTKFKIRHIRQSSRPTSGQVGTGELVIWEDSDSEDCELIYKDEDGDRYTSDMNKYT